ncbi:hypothetical protein DB30_04989 [Enhygromyxa salina]|uniref:NTE family protein RssA n=1 Tax=Enhygromyxa salina TaxID=215803 RepID=A0A0C2D7Y8_9BACT|nr:cyclic nucleotide-binding and patatin-like phospholipase domain-containing protein [Enhygromyxa salina]KIG16117.1 hypothetical protein DB30_04989 [Enhygromyxa salina]
MPSNVTREDLVRFLAETSELPLQIRDDLPIRVRIIRAREPLLRAGEPSERAYVVYRGLFEVLDETSEARRLAWLSSGSWIGELGVLMGEARIASVVAWRDSVVLEFDAADTRELLTSDPAHLAALTRHLLRRGRRSVDPRPRPFVLGLIHAREDAALLREAIARTPETALVDGHGWQDASVGTSESLESLESTGVIGVIGAIESIAALEREGADARCLILLADQYDPSWTRMVIRAADRVAALGRVGGDARTLERSLELPGAARGYDRLSRLPTADPPLRDELARTHARDLTLRPDSVEDIVDYLQQLLVEYGRPDALRQFELFEGLDDAALAQAQENIEWRMIERGDQLIRAGDEPDGLYLIAFGRLEASVRGTDGARIKLSESGAREVVGDTGLVLERPRTANVHAKRDTRVGFLSAASFKHLESVIPQLSRNAARIASERTLVPSGVALNPAPTDIMLLRLDPCPRSEAFVRALERSLHEALGCSATLVSKAIVDRQLGPGASARAPGEPGYRQLVSWLHRVSMEHDVVLYECDAHDSAWARCCVRQADRLVLIAAAGRNPALRPFERELADIDLSGDLPVDLVVLQRAGIARAAGTRAWLRERRCELVHHVRDDSPADVAATARRLMGRANGIAFAGASSRAPAHCGVPRAFTTLGLPLDLVAGTSAGSLIAAGVAMGFEFSSLLEQGAYMGERLRLSISKLQPPLTSLTSGKLLDELFHDYFGDADIEDLLIPCRLTAVDLLTHELLYLDRGPLWLAARASCSIPVLYPPVTMNGRILVDGGIISYIPINAILPSCQRGLAVMSNLNDPTNLESLRKIEPYGTQVSGWSQLLDQVLPWRTPRALPRLETILFLSLITSNSMSADRIDEALAHPAVCQVYQPLTTTGLFGVTLELAREFEQKTYERACAEIGAWLEQHGRAQ